MTKILIIILYISLTKCQIHDQHQQTDALTPNELYIDWFPLTLSNFSSKVFEAGRDPWVILFHDGQIERKWKTMSAALRGVVWFGMIDRRDEEQLMREIDYQRVPEVTAHVYPYGPKKTKKATWESTKSPEVARLKAVRSLPNIIQRLNPDDLQDFLLDSYLATPSQFPVIIVSDDDQPAGMFKALALRCQRYFNFGMISSSSELTTNLDLQDKLYSSEGLFVLMTNEDVRSIKKNDEISAIPYNVDKLGEMTLQFFLAVNAQFRFKLPGQNQSHNKKELEMLDVLEIEQQRFDVESSKRKKKPGTGTEKLKAETYKPKSDPYYKEKSEL